VFTGRVLVVGVGAVCVRPCVRVGVAQRAMTVQITSDKLISSGRHEISG
jgi:hypothetical protein